MTSLTSALGGHIPHYAVNHFRANPDMPQIGAFHLQNREAKCQLKINRYGKRLDYTISLPTLESLWTGFFTYKEHIAKLVFAMCSLYVKARVG